MDKYSRPLVTLDTNPLESYFKVEDEVPDRTAKHDQDGRAVQALVQLQQAGAIRLHVGMSTAFEYLHANKEMDPDTVHRRLEALGIDRDDIFTGPRTMAFARAEAPGTLFFGIDQETGIPLEIWFNRLVYFVLFQGRREPDARNPPFEWWRFRDDECARLGITGTERDALVELDAADYGLYIPSTPSAPRTRPTPALAALSPQRRVALSRALQRMNRYWWNRNCDAQGLYNHISHAYYTSVPQHAVFVTSDRNFTVHNKRLKMTNLEYLQTRGFPGHILEPAVAIAYLQRVIGGSAPADRTL